MEKEEQERLEREFKERMARAKKRDQEAADADAERLRQEYLKRTGRTEAKP